jgi:hypothetical protein
MLAFVLQSHKHDKPLNLIGPHNTALPLVVSLQLL